MKTEMEQHKEIGTWEPVQLPTGRVAIGCRWVYAVKTTPSGDFEKAKARLVAQGFTQRPGIDYYDITSPVVKFDSIRTILATANYFDWEIEMMDVKGAYLNSILDEEIYMAQPDHFNDGTGRVLKLVRAIYGLKQAGRVWHQKLCHVLANLGFSRSAADECVYIKKSRDSILIITIYVDDLGLFTTSKEEMVQLKGELKSYFTMTDLGEMKKILGIQVIRDRKARTLKITQGAYIDKILARFNMVDANPVTTPLPKNIKINDIEAPPDDQTANTYVPYAKAIGSLMYAAIQTQPDIAFAVQNLSQYTSQPAPEHWTAVKRVLRYLKGTRDEGIIFKGAETLPKLEIFSDADFANRADAKSISGYACIMDGACIAWSSKKQGTVALSTTEAEYIALTHAAKQMIWIRRLLNEIGLDQSKATLIRCDNLSAITITHDTTYHAHTKHINIAYHFIHEKVASNEALLTHVASKDNIADIMTKAISPENHNKLKGLLGITGEVTR